MIRPEGAKGLAVGLAVSIEKACAMKLAAPLAIALLSLAPAAAHATDVTGLWIVSTSFGQAPLVMDCSVLQVGVTLGGWCEPESPDAVPAPLSGQLDRTNATWTSDLMVQGRPVRIAYQGTLSADSLAMAGKLSYGGAVAGLSAVRK